MSRSALVRALEVPETQVQPWETGKTSPSVWAAVEAAKALGTTVEALTAAVEG
ncbi:MAG: helix-turn-helix transcriptional regulator [Candidatus Sericytochromatia bacterium]|nr:helix-turn-helix transcriptional regulator [Candidatus Sericytochromatia bacterium]